MTTYKYSFKDEENAAKAVGISLPISNKQSKSICTYLRGKKIELVKKILQEVIKKQRAVPFTKHTNGIGHRKGMASGSYPIKSSQHILDIIKSAEANAQFKGLNTANLVLKYIIAKKAPTVIRYGRKGGKKAKRTHIEIMLQQTK